MSPVMEEQKQLAGLLLGVPVAWQSLRRLAAKKPYLPVLPGTCTGVAVV